MKTVENKLAHPLTIDAAIFKNLRELYNAQEILRIQDMCAMVDPNDSTYTLRQLNYRPHELLTLQREFKYAYSTFAAFIKKLLINNIIEVHTKMQSGLIEKHIVLNPSLINKRSKTTSITMLNLKETLSNS